MDVMSVRSVALVNSSNHQLLVSLSFPLMFVMSVTSAVLPNSLKQLMLLNLSVPVIQLIPSFVIPLVSLFLILLVTASQLKLIAVNQKRPHERLVTNKDNRQHDFTKPITVANILMMSIYFHELVLLFFMFHHNFCNNNVDNFFKGYVKCNNFSTNKFLMSNSFICREFNSVAIFNIPRTNVLSSSTRFYHFSFSFYEYSVFTNSAFYNIFNVNSVTYILDNDFYITY